jgi:four helix bundle protein
MGMDYRELGFFQKARQVTLAIGNELKNWPKTIPAQEIARQVFRAAASTGANIAEGHGRHIGQEYIHFLVIAQGSANEVDYWLNTALDCGIGNPEEIKLILAHNLETRKMLSATINSLRSQNSRSVHETPAPYSPAPLNDENELSQDKL